MLSDQQTVEAIFRTVQAFNARENKTWRAWVKNSFSSPENLASIWLPAFFFLLAVGLAFSYRWLQRPWVIVGAYVTLIPMYVSIIVGQFISIWTEAKPLYRKGYVGVIVGNAAKWGESDVQHVHALSQYQRHDIQYVLVELKAERAAWERRVGTLVGAQEKIGIIPGLVGLSAALLPQFKGVQVPSWIVGLAFGTPLLYFLGLWSHYAMMNLDRVIMLLELVIATHPTPDEASSIC
jgi:hypothetical protein